MNAANKRSLLRWVHLVFTIPILGYVYGPPAEVQPYADAVRFVFVPLIIISGFWMYAGLAFAVIGVGLWLGAYFLFGSGTAILGQIALFVARMLWLWLRARRAK
jgi:hypothetical protein